MAVGMFRRSSVSWDQKRLECEKGSCRWLYVHTHAKSSCVKQSRTYQASSAHDHVHIRFCGWDYNQGHVDKPAPYYCTVYTRLWRRACFVQSLSVSGCSLDLSLRYGTGKLIRSEAGMPRSSLYVRKVIRLLSWTFELSIEKQVIFFDWVPLF